jgi:hypothetical protein
MRFGGLGFVGIYLGFNIILIGVYFICACRLSLGIDQPPIEQSLEQSIHSVPSIKSRIEKSPTDDDSWGENDETEYVGVDDEKVFHADLISDDENEIDYIPDSDEDNDDCAVDGDQGREIIEHVTDLENPKIEVGVTFEDGQTFKRAIRQYAILNEIEIAAPYSEAKRYRGYCKAKKCKWRIHASQLQDGRTWMVPTYFYVPLFMFLNFVPPFSIS